MDEKDFKQEEENDTDSSEEIEFCWDLFRIDLCEILQNIIGKDLKSLFTPQNDDDQNNADSIYLDAKQQEIASKKRKLRENGKILISNIYGKLFIFYPQYHALITSDVIRLTNYLNQIQSLSDSDTIPDRGIFLPNKFYRLFTNIKGHKMRLSADEQYITFCGHASFDMYHIAQFFNESNPNPLWQIIQKEGENILEFDLNNNALFLVIDIKNRETSKHERILKHYAFDNNYNSQPKYIKQIGNIPHDIIMEIKLLTTNVFAICLRNGYVIFYKYLNEGKYEVIHAIDMNKCHKDKDSTKSKAVPYLITLMNECNEICIHYAIQSEQTSDKCIPYFCLFKYENINNLRSLQCILSDHTGFNEINHKDMSLSSHQGIQSIYIPYFNYLIFCCKHDYQLSIYGPNREALDCSEILIKYDEDRGKFGHICDVTIDYINNIKVVDMETDKNTLPPVPILYCLSNKLNIGCFNIIPYDESYSDKQLLPIMKKPIYSLPPIPICNNNNKLEQKQQQTGISDELLNKYKILYKGYLNELYKKYAPNSVHKIPNLMAKYSSTYQQLQQLYEKVTNKYEVDPNDIKPLITPTEMESIQFDANGNIIKDEKKENDVEVNNQQESPKTPLKIFDNNNNNASRQSYVGFPDDGNDNDGPKSLDFSGLGALNFDSDNNNNNNSNLLEDLKDNNPLGITSTPPPLQTMNNNNGNDIKTDEVIQKQEQKQQETIPPKKKEFSSEIFDTNVPNEEVTYEFFNAFKQIQVEIERLKIERQTFTKSMNDTSNTNTTNINECANKLNNLNKLLKKEKQICNGSQSELFERKLKTKHHEMYTEAIELKATATKLEDPTYKNALKQRGLNDEQEQILYKISNKINDTQQKIDELRQYKYDETNMENNNKPTANDTYKICQQVEKSVKAQYNKYLDLIGVHAPHLLVTHVSVNTPKKLIFNSNSTSPKYKNKKDELYRRHSNLNKNRFRNITTPKQYNTSSKLNKYEKRLNYSNNILKPIKPTAEIRKYTNKQFITPSNNTTRTQSASQSPLVSPNKTLLGSVKRENKRYSNVNENIKNFQTKIQRTPCKSSKKPANIKRLASEKKLLKQKTTVSVDDITTQIQRNLQFKETPGFKTIKREDRKKQFMHSILNKTPYKPPKKPSNFKQFSPEREEKEEKKQVEVVEQKQVEPQQVLAPKVSSNQSVKPNLLLNAMSSNVTVNAVRMPEVASNNILGLTKELTKTPPPLQKNDNNKSEGNAWKWGNDEKKEEGSGNNNNNNNIMSSWNIGGNNNNNNSNNNNSGSDPVSIYKQRITKIYEETGQGGSEKLKKVLGSIDNKRNDIDWIHGLYVKICTKYKRNPEPKIGNNNNNNNNNSNSGNNWGFNNNNQNSNQNNNNQNNNNQNNPAQSGSSWGMTNTSFGNSGFGSMSNWGASNQNQNQNQNQNPNQSGQSTNVFSNFGNNNSGGNNNNNNSGGNNNNTSWNWGASDNNQNNNNQNNNNNNNMGFASTMGSNQPSWVNNNLSSMASGGGGGGGNNNGNDNPFAAFANNSGGGFASLLNN